MRPHDLLPDPSALGGDQPRGGAGAGGSLARCDDHPGYFCAALGRTHCFAEARRARILRMTAASDPFQTVLSLAQEGYKYGFVTDIEADEAPPGLTEDTV